MSAHMFQCPACGKERAYSDAEAGTTYTCSCGNVNVLPGPTAAPAEPPPPAAAAAPADRSAGGLDIVFEAKPSQLANLWVIIGFLLVVIAAVWLLPRLSTSMFETSRPGWIAALVVALAYFAWMAYRIARIKSIRYTVTKENLLIEQGIIFRKLDNIELFRVTDLNVERSLLQRVLGVGNIVIRSTDETMPSAVLLSIPEPREAFEKIRRAQLDADRERGVTQLKH